MQQTNNATLRWGILGTAGIARKNWTAIHTSGSTIAAGASRTIERSHQFIKECQAIARFDTPPTALGNYDELFTAPGIDAIYVPLPTGLRKDWVIRAAKAGKHVLCEKPCALSASDLSEMIDACRQNHVQFMDGVMFMHNLRLDRMRQVLDDSSSVGQIKRISSMFTFSTIEDFYKANIRVHGELEPAGCLGDLGWYNIRFTLWLMNWRMPREVTARTLSQRGNSLSPTAVPTDFSAELIFDDDTSATFFCSFLTAPQQWVQVSGAKGYLRVPDFVHPFSIHEPSFETNKTEIPLKVCDCPGQHTESRSVAQDTNMFRNFAAQVRSGKLNEDWPMMALKTQQVMDACLQSAINNSQRTYLT